MAKFIYTTFGTRDVLQGIQAKHKNRNIYLAIDNDDQDRFQLIEATDDEKSPFASGTTYEVLDTGDDSNSDDLRGWMQWSYIILNEDESDAFIRRYRLFIEEHEATTGLLSSFLLHVPDTFDYAILTTWTTHAAAQAFAKQRASFFDRYTGLNSSRYNLREKQFSFSALTK